MNLILPDNLVEELNAEREEMIQRQNTPMVLRLNRELKQVDRFLEIVYVGEKAPRVMGIEPGRWHIRRCAPGLVDSYWPIMGPDREYVDLSMRIIEDMKADDLWREGALQELKDRHQRETAKRKKATELRAEQARDELALDLRAAGRVFGNGGMEKRTQFRG